MYIAARFKRYAGSTLALLLTIQASGQTDRSPEDLIRFLTDSSRLTESEQMGISSCAQHGDRDREDEEAVQQLVSQGDAAALKLELFLGWLASGEAGFVPNTWSLFSAYARIKGPAAFPFLWTLYSQLKDDSHFLTDGAMARAFGMTSYVPSSYEPVTIFCWPDGPPAGVLDQLIASWEKGDRESLEAALGPNARAALSAAVKNKTWAGMRSELWPVQAGELTAVGYSLSGAPPDLRAKFATRSGNDCGERKITMVHLGEGLPSAYQTYLLDNTDILDVLRLIGTCAAKP